MHFREVFFYFYRSSASPFCSIKLKIDFEIMPYQLNMKYKKFNLLRLVDNLAYLLKLRTVFVAAYIIIYSLLYC